MEINYRLGLEDYLEYQRYVIYNKKDRETNNRIRNWLIFISLVMIVVFPIIIKLIFKENFILIVTLIVGVGLSIYTCINAEKIWWKDNKKNYRKALIENIFKNEDDRIDYKVIINENDFIILMNENERKYKITDIMEIKVDDNYLFFYFSDGKGTIIPIDKIPKDDYGKIITLNNIENK